MAKKKKTKTEAEVHEELRGFDIQVDPFGQMKTSFSVDRLNNFLDKNVEDRKVTSSSSRTEEE